MGGALSSEMIAWGGPLPLPVRGDVSFELYIDTDGLSPKHLGFRGSCGLGVLGFKGLGFRV